MAQVLDLYIETAVLIPTFDKSDLPGAGIGVLIGHRQIAGYMNRFMAKKNLCGTIDTLIEQKLGAITVYSGVYTFTWDDIWKRSAGARYTFVGSRGSITTHHSSQLPGK